MSDRKPSVVKQYKDLEPGDVYLALRIPNDPEHAWTTAPNVYGETDGFGRDSNRLYSMVTLGGQWHIENTTNGEALSRQSVEPRVSSRGARGCQRLSYEVN